MKRDSQVSLGPTQSQGREQRCRRPGFNLGAVLAVGAFLLSVFEWGAHGGDAPRLSTSDAENAGNDAIRFEKPNGEMFTVVIMIKKSGDKLVIDDGDQNTEDKEATAGNKRDYILAEMRKNGVEATADGDSTIKNFTVKSIQAHNTTGEHDSHNLTRPQNAEIEFGPNDGFDTLFGVDGEGAEAIYSSSIGLIDAQLGTVMLEVSFPFSELGNNTVDGLMEMTFELLAAQLQVQGPSLVNRLTLDLEHDTIAFIFPPTALEGGVLAATTDVALSSRSLLQSVPDGGHPLMLEVFGCLALVNAFRKVGRESDREG